MSTRAFGIICAATIFVVAVIALVLHIQQSDAARIARAERADVARALIIRQAVDRHACLAARHIRQPLLAYIQSEIRLVNTAKRAGIATSPPQLKKLNTESFHNLIKLRDALAAEANQSCAPPT